MNYCQLNPLYQADRLTHGTRHVYMHSSILILTQLRSYSE